jgi:hypothetical protein
LHHVSIFGLTRTPQSFSDVFDSPHTHSGKIHLHQRFFLLPLSFLSPVAFDDGGLNGSVRGFGT